MELQNSIERIIKASGAESVGVGVCDFASGIELYIQPDAPFHSASTMKVCVMMELFHQADLGELDLTDTIAITNEFPSIVDGSPFSVDPADDSEQSLHTRIGESESLIDLAWPMITHSSNFATNLLVERLGADRITAFMHELGATGLNILRGVEDGRAYRLGMNNIVTARGMTTIMSKLGRREVVSTPASDAMLEILLAQTHLNCIPAGLPIGTKVANKTGWNDGICHDVAIVYPAPRSPYSLVVLTRGLDEKTTGQQLIAEISECVFAGKLQI